VKRGGVGGVCRLLPLAFQQRHHHVAAQQQLRHLRGREEAVRGEELPLGRRAVTPPDTRTCGGFFF